MSVKVRDDLAQVKTLPYSAVGATVKDTVYLTNGIPMLAINSKGAGEKNVYVFIGVIEYAKLAAQEWTGGVKVYWDDVNKRFTTSASGNTLAGIAYEYAANPSSTGLVYLNPFLVGTNGLENLIADPGTGQAIPVTASGVIAITTGAAGETNTLAAPTRAGQVLVLTCDVHGGGNRVITAAAAINQAGNTIMTFGAAADTILLYATKVAGALVWRVGSNDGVALS